MFNYVLKRVLILFPTLIILSFITFFIIQLPPGDFATTFAAEMAAEGSQVTAAQMAKIREDLGLDQPMATRYWKWITGIIFRGDFGYSFTWKASISDLIGERLFLTFVMTGATLLFTYLVAIPIGIYSATHQYKPSDYIVSFLGFIGLATPNFLLALVIMFSAYRWFGLSVGGLFSPDYVDAAMSFGKFIDFLKHLIVPIVVIGTASIAGLMRIVRANLLDELDKQYVVTARSKGVDERKLLFKYPIRAAMNPVVSTIGYILPELFSGSAVTAIVLNLPTVGTLLMGSLLSQDMYLAGSLLLILAFLTMVGTLISDILLAWLDPRIRLEGKASR